LIKSGIGILPALTIISKQSRSQYLKEIFGNIQNDVRNGKSLSSSLSEYPKVFPSLYIAMVKSGEGTGTLQESLLRIANYRQREEEILSRVRSALAYPVLMAFVGAGTIVFMLTYVIPRLMKVFERLGQELPLPTKILISISSGLQQWWFWILVSLIIVIYILKQGSKTKAQKAFLSQLKLKFPVLGDFIHKNELAKLSRTLELLIKSGIPILKAIEISIPILGNEVLKSELMLSYKKLEEGESFGRSLENSKLFPGFMTSLIIVGEASGRLDEALGEIASSYERDTDEAVKVMTSLLEPIMILVMGVIVGFIVMAMLLPIFEISPVK